jgi:hypothetical protein
LRLGAGTAQEDAGCGEECCEFVHSLF